MSSILQVQQVSKLFGGLPAVDNVSFEVKEGEILGLIGPNGAGKTTLFNVIAGYHEATSGEVLFKGRRITGFRPDQVCKLGVARTFQVVRPFGDMTVLDNAMVGAFCKYSKAAEARAQAQKVIEFVGLGKYADTAAKNLTIADRKRLEFARALATDPEILMLDEVMAGLRPNEIDDSLELIRKVRKSGVTIIIVEHIMRAIMSICERIVVLDHGVMIAEGSPEEIANDPKVIEAYLGKEDD